jgi:CotS family spore coat protein
MTRHLWGNGFKRVPRVVDTLRGGPVCVFEGEDFTLTTWQDAREASLEKARHMRAAAAGLAQMHLASAGFQIEARHASFNRLGTWFVEIANSLAELRYWRDLAERRAVPTDLDRLLLHEYPRLQLLCEKAYAQLARTDYGRLLSEARTSGVYCHDSLYYQNILIDRRGAAHFVDLQKSMLDIRARDIAQLITRRLKHVAWEPDEALFILDSYQRVVPLSQNDLAAVYSRMLFPERFLKRFRAHFGHRQKSVASSCERVMSYMKWDSAFDRFLAVFPDQVDRVYGVRIC